MVIPLDSQEESRHSRFILAAKGTDVVQGTLDMLILKSLSLQPMHGFGVAQRIEQISEGVFKVNPGSLLVAFQRLERGDLIDAEWRTSENNRRARYYRLTSAGHRRLKSDTMTGSGASRPSRDCWRRNRTCPSGARPPPDCASCSAGTRPTRTSTTSSVITWR